MEPGSLLVLYPGDKSWRAVREAAWPALVAGSVAAAVVVLVSTVLARRLVRPIRQLGDQTATIAAGRFVPVPLPPRDDELRNLAVSINRMQEQLRRHEEEVRQSERLRTLGQFGAGTAHHLRNAATGALLAIELHQRECPVAAQCESLPVALRQLRLAESYVKRFLRCAGRRPSLGRCGWTPWLRTCWRCFAPRRRTRGSSWAGIVPPGRWKSPATPIRCASCW